MTAIATTRNGVSVTLKDGKVLTADNVLVTVPIAVLQKANIKFTPALPTKKQKAIQKIGAGLIEKVSPVEICSFQFHDLHLQVTCCTNFYF